MVWCQTMRSRLLGLLLCVVPALARPATAGELFEGRCHMDVCSWYSVEEKDLVGTNAKGALFKVVIKGWTSQHPNGSYGEDPAHRRQSGVSYVFCSKSEPLVITGAENRWSALVLAPYVSSARQRVKRDCISGRATA